MKEYKCDVLVIGGGIAGMQAVYSALNAGSFVVHVLKGKTCMSGSSTFLVTEASGYGMADGMRDPEDNPDIHFNDIMEASQSMADPKLVRILVEEAPKTKYKLEQLGVQFEKHMDGKYIITQGCFSSKPRNYTLRMHGAKIVNALYAHENKTRLIRINDCMITNLLVEEETCYGGVGITSSGIQITILAASTVLCTGGAGNLFSASLNPQDITGDGYALGFRAGCKLMNMEFMQFGCGICHPGFSILNSWIWSLHPIVLDKTGTNIFDRILPPNITSDDVMDCKSTHYPFSSTNISRYVEIAIQKAKIRGDIFDHGGISFNVSEILKNKNSSQLQLFKDMWAISKEWYLSHDIDITKGPIGVKCFAHAVNGGLCIDDHTQTSINGLFAAGETAAGPHGADRLGGNMLPTCVVFGDIAGKMAAYNASQIKKINPNKANKSIKNILQQQEKILCGGTGLNIIHLQKTLQNLMGLWMMTVRTEEGMSQVEKFITEAITMLPKVSNKSSCVFAPFETKNALTTAYLMIRAAQWRKESRGSHYRDDFPITSPNYNRPFIQLKSKLDYLSEYF